MKPKKLSLVHMARGKKCPKCGNWTMHEQRPGYWYCSSCGAVTFD